MYVFVLVYTAPRIPSNFTRLVVLPTLAISVPSGTLLFKAVSLVRSREAQARVCLEFLLGPDHGHLRTGGWVLLGP